ncbi:hypothetical protein AB0L05_19670 [Nonomuraea pusilla]|uniref:hypothetical protein n=1 Tax=Nonomuraea pusilla TaxID=46177 RepID=UPI0033331421
MWTSDEPHFRYVERERLSGFLSTLRRVPLRTWMWPLYRTSFYVAPGLIACVDDDEENEECRVLFGATHRSLLRPLADQGIRWSVFHG